MKKLLFLLPMFIFGQCDKETGSVPYVEVNLYLNINEPALFDLFPIGGWIYYTGGSRGLIVYHKSQEEFVILDRHSTHNVGAGCAVDVQSDNIIIDDPCSDSQWVIMDGSVVAGPATLPLKGYDYTFVDPVLHIYN
jgi:Rieske Fe-S protein